MARLQTLATLLCIWFHFHLLGQSVNESSEKKILFVAGPPSHGWNKHEFPAGCQILAQCLNESSLGIQAKVSLGWPQDSRILEESDALVFYCDGIEDHVASGKSDELDRHSKRGIGITVLHFALETNDSDLDAFFAKSIGGYFKVGWSVNPVWRLENPIFATHPITNGIKSIEIEDEWYYHLHFSANSIGITPLLTALPPESSLGPDGPRTGNPAVREALKNKMPQVLAWSHQTPQGQRGFGFTGGHFHHNWNHSGFRKLVLNGIAWTASIQIPETGIESQIKPIVVNESIEKAIAIGDKEDVIRYLEVDPSLLNKPGRGSYTPLHVAILRKQTPIMNFLLEKGADPNQRTQSSQTALHIAISRSDINAVIALIAFKADIQLKDGNGWTPLHLAAAKNNLELVSLLIKEGAILDALSDAGGTPLHEASVSGSPELIQFLIEKGVDPSIKSNSGKTALDHAIEFKNEPAISILKSLGNP